MTERLLIVCFSDISKDARVLKQLAAFVDAYEVTTCGFGAQPHPAVTHLNVELPPRQLAGALQPLVTAILQRLRLYRLQYWLDPHVRRARRALRGRGFDIVLANDIDTVPLALSISAPQRVHADLHEYFPGLHDDSAAWNRLRKPYFEWLIRHYALRAASATTVGKGIAEAYRDNYGLSCEVATNASPLSNLSPRPVASPIRLVHSGVAQPGRQLELTMSAVARARNDLTLDLFLMPSDHVYLERLQALAQDLGERVRVLPPLPQRELIAELNNYDVGVFVLPPTTDNNANALPNKFFDFVQARLGVVIGPSPEMAQVLSAHGFGAVAADFTEDALVAVLEALTPSAVAEWKKRADDAAPSLSAVAQVAVWVRAIAAIARHVSGADARA
jgi:hypothetical protein